jgi:hypothetical protein
MAQSLHTAARKELVATRIEAAAAAAAAAGHRAGADGRWARAAAARAGPVRQRPPAGGGPRVTRILCAPLRTGQREHAECSTRVQSIAHSAARPDDPSMHLGRAGPGPLPGPGAELWRGSLGP